MSFGDVFLLDSFLRSGGLMACADACGHAEPDTVRAPLASCVPAGLANRHAGDWWELTYARLLYPRARMASQRVSECLADLGSEDAKRRFVGEYLRLVGRRGETDGILVDPAGPSDSCRLPVTAISNHNGQAGEEVRLTCVAQRDTGLPLFFRHVAGNAIDVSTITRTIAALGAMCFGPRFPPQSRSIKSITHFTMPSVSRSTKGYSSIQITRSTSGMAYSSLRQTLPLRQRSSRVSGLPCTPASAHASLSMICPYRQSRQ